MAKKKAEGLDRVASTVFLVVLSLVCLVLSSCLLFVQKIDEKVLCWVFCSIIIGWGIVLISRFFGKASYKKMHDYNFSFGLFIVIIGCTGLVRASEIAASFDVVVGLICLLIGIMLLQSAIQLRSINSVLWTPELLISMVITLCSIFTLFNVEFILKNFKYFPYWVLFFASIANMLNFPLVGVKIHINNKREEKEKMVQVTQQTISTENPNILEADIKEIKEPLFKNPFKKPKQIEESEKEEPIVLDSNDLEKPQVELLDDYFGED